MPMLGQNAYVYNIGAVGNTETGTKAGYINIDDGDANNNNDAGIDSEQRASEV